MADKPTLLTARGLSAMKVGEWASDPAARGAGRLVARKLASGEVAWYYRYTLPTGSRDTLPLGTGLSLADARRQSGELARRYQAGERDLRAVLESEQRAAARERREEEAAEAARVAQDAATLGKLAAAYVEHLKAAGKASWSEVERSINRNITKPFPDVADLPAATVTVEDVMPVFHRLTKAGKLREAEKLRSYLRAGYTAARRARHDAGMHAFTGLGITQNPLAELEVSRPKEAAEKAAKAAKERKWALSQDQLRAYWLRIQNMAGVEGALLRFHLLTGGQRVMQLARLTSHDYDEERKTVTLRDTKGRRKIAYDHTVPLIPEAQRALESMRGDKGDFLFSLTEGFAPALYHNVWETLQPVSAAMLEAKEVDREFTPGIIRKTVESRLQASGVSREVRGHLLSHGLGGVQARHYEAHEYDEEKREALLIIFRMVTGESAKVTPIRKSKVVDNA